MPWSGGTGAPVDFAALVAAAGDGPGGRCLCRLFRFRWLCLQRQDAGNPVLVGIQSLFVLLDPDPDARGLEQENLGVVHLFVDVKRDAQILQVLRPIVCACSLECRNVIFCQTCRPSDSPSAIFHVTFR